MHHLVRAVLQFIRRHDLLKDGDTVVAAVSGGPDSVALARALIQLSRERALRTSLHVAHMNHGLRGPQADQDEQFCRTFAADHCLPITVEKSNVLAAARERRRSVEEAARQLRYDFLGRVAESVGARVVATGHHADDVAETVLLRLLRGTAVHGLAAMAPSRPIGPQRPRVLLVRPLLGIRHQELVEFLEELGQPYCADSSNLQLDHTRNRIRHELIPVLRRLFPTFSTESLCNLNEAAHESAALLADLLARHWPALCRAVRADGVLLDAEALAALPVALRKAAAQQALRLSCAASGRPGAPALRRQHYAALAALPEAPVGTQLSLPAGFMARRDHGLVVLCPPGPPAAMVPRELPVPGTVDLEEIGWRLSSYVLPKGAVTPEAARSPSPWRVHLDLSAVTRPLFVRNRRPGDRFRPLGAPVPVRLKKFLISRRVPLHDRDRIPLVTTATGEIAWVVGCEIADSFRVTAEGRRVIRLEAARLG